MDILYINSAQPKREAKLPSGDYLQFRTFISKPNSVYLIFDIHNIAAQIMLYRWARSDDWLPQVAIGDLHDYLRFEMEDTKFPKFSKNHMGRTMVQSVTYEPKKLKGVTKDNPKVVATYYIPNRLDLVYGLEWMICAWLKKFEEDMEAGLNEIASEDLDNLFGLYIEPIVKKEVELVNPDWKRVWRDFGLKTQNYRIVKKEKGPRPTLRSF